MEGLNLAKLLKLRFGDLRGGEIVRSSYDFHCRPLCSQTNCEWVSVDFFHQERIAAAFQNCRQQARERGTGALLFIDEIDAVCPKRDDASEVAARRD